MNHEPSSPFSESLLAMALPIKPLNFTLSGDLNNSESKRDFNSSSETYVSEDDEQDVAPPPVPEKDTNRESTITADASLSPSKSIMRTTVTPLGLPKKMVAFKSAQVLETHHLYTPNQDNDDTQLPPSENIPENLAHSWSEFDKLVSFTSLPPPAPPPHTLNTITGLLTADKDIQDNDADISRLSEYRSHRLPSTPLKEKLEVFLGTHDTSDDYKTRQNNANDDLADHLDMLGSARDNETSVNIHNLSHQLDMLHTETENPLRALGKSLEVYLCLAHSSQSSLQSLVEENRYLSAENVFTQSRGFELKDGIKGFSDLIAGTLIQNTDHDSDSEGLTFGHDSQHDALLPSESNSMDQSYNSTEKSIMSLLNSQMLRKGESSLLKENSASSLVLLGSTEKVEGQNKTDILRNPFALNTIAGAEEGLTVNPKELPQVSDNLQESIDLHNSPASADAAVFATPLAHSTDQFELPAESNSHSESVLQFKDEHSRIENEATSPVKKEPSLERVKPENVSMVGDPEIKEEDISMVKPEASSFLEEHTSPVKKHEPLITHYELSQGLEDEVLHPADILDDSPKLTLGLPKLDDDYSSDLEHHENAAVREVDTKVVATSLDVKLVPHNLQPPPQDIVTDNELADSSTTSERKVPLDTVFHNNINNESEGLHYEDTSENPIGHMLVPGKESGDDVGNDSNNDSTNASRVVSKLGDNSFLANSSNIQHPILLPTIGPDEASFADLTRRLEQSASSFEESLSAEHDQEKPSNPDFLSIWRSQQRSKKFDRVPLLNPVYNVSAIRHYHSADTLQRPLLMLPHSFKPRKFTDVNLVSRRVVSPGGEDLHVSGFLPEISRGSDLEQHFCSLIGHQSLLSDHLISYLQHQVQRRKSFDSLNLLTQIDGANIPDVPPQENNVVSLRPRSLNLEDTYRPELSSEPKKSKFFIPPFEIKRTNSVLSPKNQYNEIFEDARPIQPTIRAEGMKTLPSMDRDEVKRILQMKQAMSQDEYTRLKLLKTQRRPVVQEPANRFDQIQQQASIHTDSILSDPTGQRNMLIAQAVNKVASTPKEEEVKKEISFEPIHFLKRSEFPEPDFDLLSIQDNIPLTPVADKQPDTAASAAKDSQWPPQFAVRSSDLTDVNSSPTHKFKVIEQTKPVTSPKKDPKAIKIRSPLKVVKENGSVTGVVFDHPPPKLNLEPQPLVNDKVRSKKHEALPSTVSVPSNIVVLTGSSNHLEPSMLAKEARSQINGQKSRAASQEKLTERGKLFFRVVGLKNIDLPDIETHNGEFTLTLDNGVHCIKTPSYNMLGDDVTIGKEFELTVQDSLEFIMTMKATYKKPKDTLAEVKERKVVKSKNKLGRLFGSKSIVTTTRFVPRQTRDSWANLFATDGSFARCYLDLEQYETQIFGKAKTFQINCYNEWATSPRGKEKIKVEPYQVAQLEVKMMFVPRSEAYEVLPSSIRYAYESLEELKNESTFTLEGYMHQEGGDCEVWKKRWFQLKGTSLIAHSEFSHKTRAKINLAKVVEVIYIDKENMTRSSSNYRNFSDILLVENAFKIRFANGELIDFGAPSKEEKSAWIGAIQQIVYRNKFRRQPWVQMMQEQNNRRRSLVL